MGSKVKAVCKCGVNNDILIGGGMSTFQHTEYFPCLCEDCKDVVQVNLRKNKVVISEFKNSINASEIIERYKNYKSGMIPSNELKLTCPKCSGNNVVSYTDSSIIAKVGEKEVARSFDNILTDGDYKCPRCNEMTLKFLPLFYMWD